jgi:hypothetical protein
LLFATCVNESGSSSLIVLGCCCTEGRERERERESEREGKRERERERERERGKRLLR